MPQRSSSEARPRSGTSPLSTQIVAIPVGQVLAGPLAAAIGVEAAIWCAVAVFTVAVALWLLVPDVRRLERTDLRTAS